MEEQKVSDGIDALHRVSIAIVSAKEPGIIGFYEISRSLFRPQL